jgi:hypothetical protein
LSGTSTFTLALENVAFGNMSLGFTWLLKLKQNFKLTKNQFFMTMHTCSCLSIYNTASTLSFNSGDIFAEKKVAEIGYLFDGNIRQ